MSLGMKKVLRTALIILIAVFLGYQMYSSLYRPITTATAVSATSFEGSDITGYFIRDEEVITKQTEGAVRYVIDEGEKVANGGVIAEIYSNTAAAENSTRVKELEAQIASLEAINSVNNPTAVDLDTLNNKINQNYISYLNSTENGIYTSASAAADELLTNVNKKQIITGEVQGFDNLLASLKGELATLKSAITAPVSTVTANKSGFFVSAVDGYEDTLSVENIDQIDEAAFEALAAEKKTGEGFGKIVSDYKWYIVAKMNNDKYLNFAVGNTLTLKTKIPGSEELTAEVYKVNISEDKNSAIVILSCNVMNGQIASTRTAPITIINKSYEGIRISRNSIRVVEGKSGVYVVQGSVVKFKPIEIIHTEDEYVICQRYDDGDASKLRLYDEIIEKGKGLYDGKYID